MNNYEALYGFSGVLILSGGLPNSDGGLAVLHEMKNAARVSASEFCMVLPCD